jgi:ArsR family transcriptional regulator, arsenate/arsenite/antimonite-responsive transcriptional repressor
MEMTDAVAALAALGQDSRLDVFRLLVQAGPQGMPAGEIAAALGVPPNTLSFHFDRLRFAGLVSVRRNGRSMIYSANFSAMTALVGFLTENCCGGKESCGPSGGAPGGDDEPAQLRRPVRAAARLAGKEER